MKTDRQNRPHLYTRERKCIVLMHGDSLITSTGEQFEILGNMLNRILAESQTTKSMPLSNLSTNCEATVCSC